MRLASLVCFALVCCAPALVHATGGGDPELSFAPVGPPEEPAGFVAGRLGVLRADLPQPWLALAWRLLAGKPLDETAQKAILHRGDDSDPNAVEQWVAAHKEVPEPALPKELAEGYYGRSYTNCLPDAWITAARTLRSRVAKYGARSAEVKDWTAAQDLVFANCETSDGKLPDEKIAAGVAPALQKDRDYQVAAALLYQHRNGESAELFERIAKDRASPWSGYGLFISARALLRLGTADETPEKGAILEAEKRLRALLADKDASALHASARRLLRFAAFRSRPEAQLRELAGLLMKENDADLGSVLGDFSCLSRRLMPESPTADDIDTLAGGDELLDWTASWSLPGDARLTRALGRWHSGQKPAWLLMALATVEPKDARAGALIEAGRKIKRGTPGYATAAYHRARLLVGQQRLDAARALLDEALATSELSPGARNLVSQLRFAQARTLDEALAVALRTPLYDGVAAKDERTLDDDGAALFFEELPLAESLRAAQDARLERTLRGRLLREGWLRAALVDDVATAQSLLAPLEAYDEGKDKLVPQLRQALAAPTAEERRYGLVHMWLRNEASLQVMICHGANDETFKGTSAPHLLHQDFVPAPFVDAALRARARAETARLDALASDETVFRADQVVLWAKAHPDDPRVPEDLHLVVEGTRYPCERARATAASKRAWKLLHERFPKSPWTRKTKYWYP